MYIFPYLFIEGTKSNKKVMTSQHELLNSVVFDHKTQPTIVIFVNYLTDL